MVVVTNVDAYPSFSFSDLTCHHVLPDIKETKLGSSDQEASPSAGKTTGVVLVPCCAWKCVPTAISGGVDILEVHGCHLLRQMSRQ